MKKLKRKQEIVLNIEKVAFGGQGIARMDDFVVLVDNTVPGDRVRVRLRKVRKHYAEAFPVEILEASTLRREAPCKHFGTCGGCKWQNLPYAVQLEFKKAHVLESLEHIGKISPKVLHDVIPSPLIYGYRNKMEFSFSGNRWLTPEELNQPEMKKDFALGFHVPRYFDRVIDIEKCWLQSDLLNHILHFSRKYFRSSGLSVYHLRKHQGILRYLMLRRSFAFGEVMVNVVTSEAIVGPLQEFSNRLIRQFPEVVSVVNNVNARSGQSAVGEEEHLIYGKPTIRERLGDFIFEISANSFFQTNPLQAENLYRIVAEYARLTGKEVVWDMYSGTGSIAVFLSPYARQVRGFELIDSAVRDARRNAALNAVTNCSFVKGDIRMQMKRFRDTPPDVVICDPPRAGMHPEVVALLTRLRPERIVYVSCNPATMARDLAGLIPFYWLEEVQPVDMFPHTHHIESVVRLERK